MSLEFTEKELEAIRKEYCAGATDTQFDLFMSFCKRRDAMPGQHIVFQTRRTQEWDSDTGSKVWVSKPVYITTISFLRLIAQRTGEYTGQGREKYVYLAPDGVSPIIESPIPLPSKTPWVAESKVYRKGFTEPMIGVARWDAYAAYQKSADGKPVLTQTWRTRGPEQLSKCSEALALRKAFPEELSGMYLDAEIKPEIEDLPIAPVTPASVTPAPEVPSIPAVNQTPVEGTEAPRPNEATPEPPAKRVRKPKSPENGPAKPADSTQLSDEDLAQLDNPTPPTSGAEEAKQEAEKFVESLDPTPTPEETKAFTARVRALYPHGLKPEEAKAFILKQAGADDTKKLTVANWKQALDKLESAQKEGKLAEVVKG